MKRVRKLLGVLLSICVIMNLFGFNVYAASASLSINNKTATVGTTTTVTVSVKGTEAVSASTVNLTYDASGLQYVSTSLSSSEISVGNGSMQCILDGVDKNLTTLSFTLTFKVLKEGSFKISGNATAVSDVTMQPMQVSGASGTVTGKAKTTTTTPSDTTTPITQDTNSKLSNLQVSPGTLAPAFNADTTSYTVTVPETTTEVTIAATSQSSKATVNVSGGKDLKLGDNEAKVVVMSESGATMVYTLNIICGEPEKITIGGVDNTINESFTDEQIPVGFVRDKITYNEREYEALKMETSDLILVNLQNASGNDFYIYNSGKNEFYNFVQIQFSEGKYVIPLAMEEMADFADYKTTVITLQEKAFDAWEINEDYSLIRAMNEAGEVIVYQYDKVDGTLQRYAGEVAVDTEEQKEPQGTFFELLEKYHLYIMAGLVVLLVILSITLIYFIATRKQRHRARQRKMQKKLEQQNEE